MTLIRILVIQPFFVYPDGYNIVHRRWFSAFEFANTFVAIATGFLKTAIRLGIGFAGLLLLFVRMDIPLLGWRELQHYDPGYSSYAAVLCSDAMYNNPTWRVATSFFKKRLKQFKLDRKQKKQKIKEDGDLDSITSINDLRRLRILNKWRLLYTLVRNPVLVKYRKTHTGEASLFKRLVS